MKKFLVTYHAPVSALQQMSNASPEEQAKGMEMWMQWAGRVGNKMVDMGAPLMNGTQLGVGGSSKASDKQVTGFSIIQAESLDEAKALLAGHPHTSGWSPDATIEVHESVPMPGM